MLLLLSLLACGKPEAPAASAPATPVAAAPAAAKAAPGKPAPPEWSKIPMAEGAVASAQAATEVPPAFRNAAGEIACPVMGNAMETPDDVVSYADHGGVRYYFCCDSCEKRFLEDPEAYANGRYLDEHELDPTAPAACEPEK